MTRARREQRPGGTYYLFQNGGTYRPVFVEGTDYARFERTLAQTAQRSRASVHAFCLLPEAIHLAVTVSDIPVAVFMQSLTSRYAKQLRAQTHVAGHFFRRRYDAALVQPDHHLLELVRYIHYCPEPSTARPLQYLYSSHLSYAGTTARPWLHMATVLRLLRMEPALGSYTQFMSTPPNAAQSARFADALAHTPHQIGSDDFFATLPRPAPKIASVLALERLITDVAQLLELDPQSLAAQHRERKLVVARALVAFLATQRGIATLTEVASRFGRHKSSLSLAVARHRIKRPDLFRLDVLRRFEPLSGPRPR